MDQPIKLPRTFELVSEHILDRLGSGELRLGDRLPNERELAKSLQVSRHAVREALRSLESRGLLQLRKGAAGGAFISSCGSDVAADVMRGMLMVGGISLEQLTEARRGIEALVVRRACERADAAAIETLEENVRQAEAETKAGHRAKKTQLNIEFHALLAQATQNPVLELVMKAILGVLAQFASTVGSVMDLDVIASRRRLLRYMKAGNLESAVAEMDRHLCALHRFYLDAVARSGHTISAGPLRKTRSSKGRKAWNSEVRR